jgi:cobalamin biosynthesis protein CobT
MGTIAVYYFGINHSESFNQDVFDFLRLEVFPVIDKHNDSKSPNALRTAEKIAELIQDFLSQDQTSVSNKQEISEDNDSDIPSKQDADSSSGNDSDDSTGDNQAPVHNTDENEKNGGEIPLIENSAENTKPTGCDIASHMAKRIENDMSFTPPNYPIIADYRDTVTDLSDSRCMNSDVNTNIYQHVCKEYAPAISAYRNMFGSFLISTARCRTLKTQSGKFNHRDITHIVTSPVPRIFTRKLEGRKFGYDVTLLMDCSGSMGEFSFKESRDSKIMKAYEALVILAEALRGLSGINLEILAFTADIRYTPGMHLSISDSCNNQLFILKPFANHAAGALPFFPSLHKEYHLSEDNFDIGAIKISSRRLRQMPSLNRKLLIVLSDGQPSSDISSGTEILKSYVEELSHIHPILGIGLENPHIGQCYPNSVNINDLSELSGQVLINIRNFLIKQMTG